METLKLVELVDRNLNLKSKFYGLEKISRDQKKVKIEIYGFREKFLGLDPLTLKTIFYINEITNENILFLEGYRVSVQKEIFNFLNKSYKIPLRNYSDLKELLRCFKNCDEEKEINSFNKRYLNYIIPNLINSKTTYTLSREAQDAFSEAKNLADGNFNPKNLNDYLEKVYNKSGLKLQQL